MGSTRGKRSKQEEHENHERWLVSYADFITLLFAFFVVMYATSSQNLEKEKQFEEAIRAEFKMAGMSKGNSPLMGQNSGQNENSYIEQPIPQQRREGVQAEIYSALKKKILESFTEAESKKILVKSHPQGVRLILSAEDVFTDSTEKINPEKIQFLNRFIELFKESIYPIMIEGHSDYSGIDNWELSTLRATTMVRYLIKVHKIPSESLSASGFADQKPMGAQNEQAGSLNNRLEVVILIKEEN